MAAFCMTDRKLQSAAHISWPSRTHPHELPKRARNNLTCDRTVRSAEQRRVLIVMRRQQRAAWICHANMTRDQQKPHLDGGHDHLGVTLQRLEHREEDAGHDGRPHQLVRRRLGQHRLQARRVLREHVLVQNLRQVRIPKLNSGHLQHLSCCNHLPSPMAKPSASHTLTETAQWASLLL